MEPVADIDKILDDILDCHVNSEYRSSCYDFDDFMQTLIPIYIYSGSFVEGFSNYNDIDIMVDLFQFDREFCLVESVDDMPQGNKKKVWMLENKECYPGYVRIRQSWWPLPSHGVIADFLSAILPLSQLPYFNGRGFLESGFQHIDKIGRKLKLCGPAFETVDFGIQHFSPFISY
eukprot:gene15024-16574_t